MSLNKVIGQEEIREKLLDSIRSKKIGTAQMFTGETGYGTFAIALNYAKDLLCKTPINGKACNSCSACKRVDKFIHPDLHFVFPTIKTSTKTVCKDYLNEWRTLLSKGLYFNMKLWHDTMNADSNKIALIYKQESENILHELNLKPLESLYKVMIFWLPEKMNAECGNALLKIIEEPYEDTVLLFVSENPDLIISTIRSRTQITKIGPIKEKTIEEELIKTAYIDKKDAIEYAHLAQGNWQKALKLKELTEEDIFNNDKFISLMRLCWARKMYPVNLWVNEITKLDRERQKRFLIFSLKMIRESFISNFNEPQINYINKGEKEFLKKFSPFIYEKNIIPLSYELERAYSDINRNGSAQIIFTDLCIKIMQNIKPPKK